MHTTLPLLVNTAFPPVQRRKLETLQVNLGYICNQTCQHCHVNAGPNRPEQMDLPTIELVLRVLRTGKIKTLDLTGGAPEINPHFRTLVSKARVLGVRVIDRCNLTILEEPGQEGLAQFFAEQAVEVTASLPCYSQANVDRQRGEGVFDKSIRGLKRLNALGYAQPGSGLLLNLVYNPLGPVLPPSQQILEADYKRLLLQNFGITFNHLFVLANMPIARFGSMLISKGEISGYLKLLKDNHQDANLDGVMCRSTISVDWQGYLYDCDFNQMLGLSMRPRGKSCLHLRDLLTDETDGMPIVVANHCYGCTAGQGSSCGGALVT